MARKPAAPSAPTPTAKCEFYYFCIAQRDRDEVRGSYWPPATKELTAEIGKKRLELSRKLRPDEGDHESPDIYKDPMHPIPPALVHGESWYKGDLPEKSRHFYLLGCPIPWSSYYQIVSPEWKRAIEAVDKGVHDFFPHKAHFKNGTYDAFVFRHRIRLDKLLIPLSSPVPIFSGRTIKDVEWQAIPGSGGGVEIVHPKVDKKIFGKHHWVETTDYYGWPSNLRFVSVELGETLRPMLPPGIYLAPLSSA